MDIKQLECFLYLAQTLSFSTTAQLMYLTQPSVSGRIKSLEAELGVTLLQRNTRTVALTPAGESFYHDVKDILELLNQAKAKAKYSARKFSEKYTISYEDNFLAVRYLSRLIARFKKVHPEIFLELKVTPHDLKNQLYMEHKIDFMFTVKNGLDCLTDIQFEELYRGRFICVLPPDHPLAEKSEISFEDLKSKDLVLLNPIVAPEEMQRMIKNIEQACKCSPKRFCDSVFSGYTLVKSGFGIAIMPDFVCLEDPDVSIRPLSGSETISYGVAWNQNMVSPAKQDFIRIAKQVYAGQ